MLPILIALSILIADPAKSDDYQEEALELLQHSEKLKNLYLKEAENLRDNAKTHIQKALKPKKSEQEAKPCKNNLPIVGEGKNKHYFIFVSLSMPKAALQSFYQEAQKQNAVLVLRGLKNGSFKETAQYLQALKIAVQIDPELFKKYQITRVPTIVWVKDNQFDSISGNISFEYAKSKFLEAQS